MLTPGVYDSRRLVVDGQGTLTQLPNRNPGATVMACDTNRWTVKVYVVTDGPILPRGPVTVQLQQAGRLGETRATQFAQEQSGGLLWNGDGDKMYTASVVAPAHWTVVGSQTFSVKNGDAKTIVLKLNPPPVWVRFCLIYDKTNIPEDKRNNPINGSLIRSRVPLLAGDQQLSPLSGADGIVQHEGLRAGADTSMLEIGAQDNTAILHSVGMDTA